jgi:outer membrane protein assembly factor BamB
MRTSTARLSKILAAGAAVAFGAAAALPAAASTQAAASSINWAQDGFNKADSGYNAYETAITPATVHGLRWQWSITSPVIQPGCRTPVSGQRAPIVDNGHLALTDQGGFAVYDATTGVQQWSWRSADPGEEYGPQLAASGTTLVSVPFDCRSETPSTPLTAFNLATGAQLWQVSPDLPIDSFAIDGTVMVATGSYVEGAVTRGYSLATGAVLWERTDLAGEVAADFAGKVLVSGTGGSTALNVATGTTAWTIPTAWTALAATADGSRVAVTDGSGQLAYLNGANGAVVWSKPNLADEPFVFSGGTKVALDGTRVYTEHAGTLYALNASTGATLWSVSVGAGAARPVVAGGIVYAPSAGQFAEMKLLDAATGATFNDEEPYVGIVAHAVVANGWLYVTTGRVLDAYKL